MMLSVDSPHNAKAMSMPKNSHLPLAKIYKVSPDYVDKVPVTMNAGKTKLISFPAVSDININTSPIELVDGFLLDRQGVGLNTMFLVWTRDEYAAMAHTPKVSDIKEAIAPPSFVNIVVQLPLSTSDAVADTAAVNELIRNGLKDCKIYYGKPLEFGIPARTVGTLY